MNRRFHRFALAGLMTLTVALAPLVACAGTDDHDALREAVRHGQILPFEEILGRVRSKLTGDIVGVKVEHKDRWLYEIRTLNPDGRMFEVEVDARSGEIERIKQK